MVADVMKWSKIQGETPNENIVVCLSKVEDNLLHLCDARNHLNWKDKLIKPNDRNGLLHLEKFEVKLQKDKVEEKLQNFKAAAEAKLIEEKERQKKKEEKMKAATVFNGKRDQFRSTKKQFKVVEKNTNIMDEQTRDEKNYLGNDLFSILGDIKTAIKKGEMEDPDAEESPLAISAPKKSESPPISPGIRRSPTKLVEKSPTKVGERN